MSHLRRFRFPKMTFVEFNEFSELRLNPKVVWFAETAVSDSRSI